VITRVGYGDESIAVMREACQEASNVPWLRPDPNKPVPPLRSGYGKALVKRLERFLKDMAEKGQLKKDGVFSGSSPDSRPPINLCVV
jgi:hypothetical protein